MLLAFVPNLGQVADAVLAIAIRFIRRSAAAVGFHYKLAAVRAVVAVCLYVRSMGAAPYFGKVGLEEGFEGRCGSADDGCKDRVSAAMRMW